KRFAPVIAIAVVLGVGYAFGWQRFFTLSYLAQSQTMLIDLVAANPVLSRLAFFAAYAAAVAVAFPAASILTVFAGFLFGWLQGGLIVATAATLGACFLFLAAKSAFGDSLRNKVGGAAKSMTEGFENDAFNYLLFLRLAPIFPFLVVNIVPALFKVPLKTYASATLLGILPGTFAYSFLGQGLGSSLDAATKTGTELNLKDLVTPQLIAAFIVLALAALLPIIIKRLRKSA
ncbi:MAG: TVP38/TMEM64 family protein, partial [Notoacmeibacter sp.]